MLWSSRLQECILVSQSSIDYCQKCGNCKDVQGPKVLNQELTTPKGMSQGNPPLGLMLAAFPKMSNNVENARKRKNLPETHASERKLHLHLEWDTMDLLRLMLTSMFFPKVHNCMYRWWLKALRISINHPSSSELLTIEHFKCLIWSRFAGPNHDYKTLGP